MATVNNQGCVPTEWKSVLTDEMIHSAGNWTPDNCRKRLSMFCNFEKISCEIVNSAVGPDHAKIAIAELKLTLRKYGKEFYAKVRADFDSTYKELASKFYFTYNLFRIVSTIVFEVWQVFDLVN